jgi:hypothetical protein
MKKMMLLATVVGVVALMLAAAPAMADSLREERKESPRTQLREENNHHFFNNCCFNRGFRNDGFVDGFFIRNNNVPEVVQAPTETFVSGNNVNNAGSVTGGGDNSNTCAAQENFNNSGGVLNQPSLQQDDNTGFNDGRFRDNRGRFFDDGRRFFGDGFSGGTTFLGPSFTNAPSQSASCNPSVEQAASSSSG